MKTKVRVSLILILVLSSMVVLTPVGAESAVTLPIDWVDELDGAAYHIRVPENWNGTLLVFARQYSSTLPGSPDAAFGGEQVEDYLLANGYGLAGTAFSEAGWAVKEGIHDTKALTNFFRDEIAVPETLILYGASMGGVITTKSIEKYPDIYDAAIPMCTSGAGTTWVVDHWLDLSLAYDVTFGWPETWGEIDDVRADIGIFTDILPVTIPQIFNPANFGKMEFIRLVNDLPQEDYYTPPPSPTGFWVASALFTYGRGELEERAGGNPAQNIGRVYSLTADEIIYLGNLGLDAEALLAEMNARTIYQADKPARVYAMKYADYKGKLRAPVLTLHTLYDSVIRMETQAEYRELVAAQGNSDLLVQVYTDGVGHCAFRPEQLLTVIQAVEYWLDTGNAPGDEFFPVSQGFVPNYDPPPWP